MAHSTDIIQRALNILGDSNITLERFALLHESLIEFEAGAEVMNYFYGTLERYVADDRLKAITHLVGDLAMAKPTDVVRFEVPGEEMKRLYGIVGFHGVPRVFLFLYTHTYLDFEIHGTDTINRFRLLVDELG